MRRWRAGWALVVSSALATLVPAAQPIAVSASPPKKNSRYVGETSQLRTLQLQVSRSGERIVDPSVVTINLECPKGRQAFGIVRPVGAKIRAGSFSFRGTDQIGAYRYVAKMTGSFRRRGRDLDGTVTLRRISSSGTVCRSGEVTYTARARRR